MGEPNPIKTPLAVKRSARRTRSVQTAIVLTATEQIAVRLRDLSVTGALVEARMPPAEGSEVVFSCSSAVVPARVAWVRGRKCGLSFHHPMGEADVEACTGSRRLG